MSADPVADAAASWSGGLVPYRVGDPGRAPGLVVPVPDLAWPEQPDTVLDGFSLTGRDGAEVLRVRAASLRGLAHRCYGRVRQDEYAWRVTEDGRYLVVCVADGLSSGALSHLAAKRAARYGTAVICGLLRELEPDALPWGQVLDEVSTQIVVTGAAVRRPGETVDLASVSHRDAAGALATTALYAIVGLCPADGSHPVTLLSVGDTSAWVLTGEGGWEPQRQVGGAGPHHPAVSALPPAPVPPDALRTCIRAGEALVLMTHGLGDPLGAGGGEVGRYLAEVWREPPADLDFAAQVGFVRRTYDDDRTAFAIWPVSG